MKRLFVVIYWDEAGELVYEPYDEAIVSRFFNPKGLYISWELAHEDMLITVFSAVFSAVPVGENREEIEWRVLAALNLIE